MSPAHSPAPRSRLRPVGAARHRNADTRTARHARPHRAAMSRAAAWAPACDAASRSLPQAHPAQAALLPPPAPQTRRATVQAARSRVAASPTMRRTVRAVAAPSVHCVPLPVQPHARPCDAAATHATRSRCSAAQQDRAAWVSANLSSAIRVAPSTICLHPAISGRQLRTGIRQSMPSSSIDGCAAVSDTAPSRA